MLLPGNKVKKSLNKNWVTVHDKCPQINVQFKWHTFKKNKKTNKNGRTDGGTNERTDGCPIILCPKFYLGALKYQF